MRPNATARRYAEASFDVAGSHGQVDRWLQDLRTANQITQQRELSSYFKDPARSMGEKLETLQAAFGGMDPHVLNLLRILLTRYRLHLLPGILSEFERLEREKLGIAEAEITVAHAIDDMEKDRIAKHLSEILGKTVEVRVRIDPSILGGLIVRVGDRLIDASVDGRLQRMRQEMAV